MYNFRERKLQTSSMQHSLSAISLSRKVNPQKSDIFKLFTNVFHLPLIDAACSFGLRSTAFKMRCRKFGIKQWPYRRIRAIRKTMDALEPDLKEPSVQHQFQQLEQELSQMFKMEYYAGENKIFPKRKKHKQIVVSDSVRLSRHIQYSDMKGLTANEPINCLSEKPLPKGRRTSYTKKRKSCLRRLSDYELSGDEDYSSFETMSITSNDDTHEEASNNHFRNDRYPARIRKMRFNITRKRKRPMERETNITEGDHTTDSFTLTENPLHEKMKPENHDFLYCSEVEDEDDLSSHRTDSHSDSKKNIPGINWCSPQKLNTSFQSHNVDDLPSNLEDSLHDDTCSNLIDDDISLIDFINSNEFETLDTEEVVLPWFNASVDADINQFFSKWNDELCEDLFLGK